MSECAREMTARNEIEALDIEERLKDRILSKLDQERAYSMEREYQQRRELERKLEERETEIRALVGYIQLKGI